MRLGSTLAHLRRGWAHPCPHLRRGWARTAAAAPRRPSRGGSRRQVRLERRTPTHEADAPAAAAQHRAPGLGVATHRSAHLRPPGAGVCVCVCVCEHVCVHCTARTSSNTCVAGACDRLRAASSASRVSTCFASSAAERCAFFVTRFLIVCKRVECQANRCLGPSLPKPPHAMTAHCCVGACASVP